MKLHFEPVGQSTVKRASGPKPWHEMTDEERKVIMTGMTDYLVTSPEEFTVRDFILHVRTDSACEGRPFMGTIEKANDGDEPTDIMRYSNGELYWGDGSTPSSIAFAKMLYGNIANKKVTRIVATGDKIMLNYLLFVEGEYEVS